MMVNAVTPGLVNLVCMVFVSSWRRLRKKAKRHQVELLELYTNPPFDISGRYAYLLTTVFCTLVYSSGMPLLTLFAAFYMLISYWTDKMVLLWSSHRPPVYDSEMPCNAVDAMFYAAGLHCIVAILMYGQTCTFPSLQVQGVLAEVSHVTVQAAANADGTGILSHIDERILRETTWMFLVFLVVLVVLWIVRMLLWAVGSTVAECLGLLCSSLHFRCVQRVRPQAEATSSRRNSKVVADEYTWALAAEHIERVCPPASYMMKQRTEFRDLVRYLRDTGSGMQGIVPTQAWQTPTVTIRRADDLDQGDQGTPNGTPVSTRSGG